MLGSALGSLVMRPAARRRLVRRWPGAAVALVLALAPVKTPRAAPDAGDLFERAAALDQEGRHAEAAALWEQAIDEAEARQRMLATFHALNAWMAAFEADGDRGSSCAARALLTRALADDQLDPRAREELRARFDDRVAAERECVADSRPPVALLDAEGPPPRPAPVSDDRPRRAPKTSAGAVLLGVAAPAVGGFVYTIVADRRIIRGYDRLREDFDATGTYDQAEAARLDAEGPVIRDLAIGLGVSTAVLTGAAIGLLVAGRGERARTSITVAPQARADLGGVVLSGRF